jgi:hypothetical protein
MAANCQLSKRFARSRFSPTTIDSMLPLRRSKRLRSLQSHLKPMQSAQQVMHSLDRQVQLAADQLALRVF